MEKGFVFCLLVLSLSCIGQEKEVVRDTGTAESDAMMDRMREDFSCDTMVRVWRDSDGDGYGDPDISSLVCSISKGWANNNTDCADGDKNAYPGQKKWFSSTIIGTAKLKYDYNCDGTEEKKLKESVCTNVAGTCTLVASGYPGCGTEIVHYKTCDKISGGQCGGVSEKLPQECR